MKLHLLWDVLVGGSLSQGWGLVMGVELCDGISALVKGPQHYPLPLPPCESDLNLPHPFYHVRTQRGFRPESRDASISGLQNREVNVCRL